MPFISKAQVHDATRTLTGEGFLCVDGRVIYGMKNFVVRGFSES